jgi:hypothetical protein
MTLAALQRRLAKIETSRRPPRGLFYAAWGRTPDEIEAVLAGAQQTRQITEGDPVVRCLWPAGHPVPASRWALDDRQAFDHDEFAALMEEVDRLQDDWLAALREAAAENGDPSPEPMDDDPPLADRDPITKAKTDAALFAAVLAVPLNGSAPTLTADRMQRVIQHMNEAGLRDRLRSRGRLRPSIARQPTQH